MSVENSSSDSSSLSRTDKTLALATALEAVNSSPEVAREFAEKLLQSSNLKGMVYRARPKGPYYNLTNAVQLKPFLDRMIKDQKAIGFYARKFNCTTRTLYLRINQSFHFLFEDPEMVKQFGITYKDLWNTIRICSDQKEKAVFIRFLNDSISSSLIPLEADDAPDSNTDNSWKIELDAWLEDTTKLEPFEKRVTLTEEQVSELDNDLSQLGGILATVETNRIKVVKFNPNK